MEHSPQSVEIRLPTSTIVKVLVTILLVWAGLQLWPQFLIFLVSLLLAVTLHPTVGWMEKRGLSRGAGIIVIAVMMLATVVLLIGFVFPPLAEQVTRLTQNFPALQARVEQHLPPDYPILKRIVVEVFALPSSPEVAAQLRQPLAWGKVAVSTVTAIFFVLVLTLYLLLDGRRLYAWLLAYVPRAHREKMATTVPEVSEVVYAYVRGQVMTSVLFSAFVATVLAAFNVPAVVPLAVLAGLCDVIPVVGIIVAIAPAVLLALTVSPLAAASVLGLYVVYHLVETYYIIPRIYGHRLRLSTLAVLLALIVGGTLQGVIGAVLVLPLVAAYPIIERIWLGSHLNPEVIKDHRALARAAETGSERAVEAVLQGEKHPWERGTTEPTTQGGGPRNAR